MTWLQRYLTEVSCQKKGYVSERYRLVSLQRDPIAKYKVAGLSGKLMAEWRDKRLKEVSDLQSTEISTLFLM